MLFLFGCFNLHAQVSKNIAEIKSLKIDSGGNLSWEIYYASRELSYQIEFFSKGKWFVSSTFIQSVSPVMPGQKEEFSVKDSLKGYLSPRRLRITEPVNIISEEVHSA